MRARRRAARPVETSVEPSPSARRRFPQRWIEAVATAEPEGAVHSADDQARVNQTVSVGISGEELPVEDSFA